ncbi:hypothetical protein NKJ71_16030 [Mesorhizobium sp. M0050]|uniref:hypothetical protein n=1 Tax=Mesorhizobium sp. M0050 TaxID=2956861 RepID=UPI003335B8E8
MGGVTEQCRLLNIAGDYIAHGIRHRAGELATLKLGPQAEINIAQKLRAEVEAERQTRLDVRAGRYRLTACLAGSSAAEDCG